MKRMIWSAVLFMSLLFGFERVKLGFVQIFNHIDMPQGGKVGGKTDFRPVQGIDGGGVELLDGAHHQVFGEDVGMRAGEDGVAGLQNDVGGNVFHHTVTVVVGFPFQAGQFLAFLDAHADNGLAVQQAHDRGIMAADVGHHAHDAIRGNNTHVARDAVAGTFINNDVVVRLAGAVVDHLRGDVFVQGVAFADVVNADGSVVHDGELFPEHGVFFGQLLVGGVEAEIVAHFAAPLVDFAHGVIGGVHHAVAVEVLATGKQQNRNHLKQDKEDDEVVLYDETPQVIHVFIRLRAFRQAQGPL